VTAPRQKILMCAPEYFGVDYVINPWMKEGLNKVDRSLAQKQWENLRRLLSADAEIVLLQPQPSVPDLVFTANAGFVIGDKVIVSRFREPERQGEEPFNREWFKQNNFTLLPWPKNVSFEGAGDALLDRSQKLIWDGHGFRSGDSAMGLLEKGFGRKVVPLKLVDFRFYHLDTCLCPLEGGWLMYYPPAFDEQSQQSIIEYTAPEKRIVVSEEDALHFACNAVDLNGKVYMNNASDALQKKLQTGSFKPIIVPLSEFMKAGGAAKCLTLKLIEN
jgi:N-dimethylarginine dimethylaminohydrolase